MSVHLGFNFYFQISDILSLAADENVVPRNFNGVRAPRYHYWWWRHTWEPAGASVTFFCAGFDCLKEENERDEDSNLLLHFERELSLQLINYCATGSVSLLQHSWTYSLRTVNPSLNWWNSIVICHDIQELLGILFETRWWPPESEKGAGNIATQKFLQIRKVFATSSFLAEEFPDNLEMSGCYTKYPNNMQIR